MFTKIALFHNVFHHLQFSDFDLVFFELTIEVFWWLPIQNLIEGRENLLDDRKFMSSFTISESLFGVAVRSVTVPGLPAKVVKYWTSLCETFDGSKALT
jgi:hypothetical protein